MNRYKNNMSFIVNVSLNLPVIVDIERSVSQSVVRDPLVVLGLPLLIKGIDIIEQ